MGWFQRLFAGKKPAPAPPAPPRPAPNWLEVDGEFVDLNVLSPAQKTQLEAVLLLRRRQREDELASHLLSLATERERLLATGDPGLWLMTLKLMFGEALGRRVAIQDIVAGMQLQHLIMSFGRPDQVDSTGPQVVLVYGTAPAISYFEVEGDTISRAVIGAVPRCQPDFWAAGTVGGGHTFAGLMRYFLHFAYDGTAYCGWQVQPGVPTVQAVLDKALSQVLRQPVHTVGSGRTDTGVHASHQVAHFEAELPEGLTLDLLRYRLNRALPPDVQAYRAHPVGAQDHARFSAEARTYEYYVLLRPDPFRRDQALYLDRAPDVAAMNEAAGYLVGQFDFTAFSKVKGGENHYVCYLYEAGWHPTRGGLVFRIRANRFVRGMVRLVVGTLLDVGRGKLTPAKFQQILFRQQRIAASGAAPAKGLFLSQVEYGPGIVPA